jgi:hypothetical protein
MQAFRFSLGVVDIFEMIERGRSPKAVKYAVWFCVLRVEKETLHTRSPATIEQSFTLGVFDERATNETEDCPVCECDDLQHK